MSRTIEFIRDDGGKAEASAQKKTDQDVYFQTKSQQDPKPTTPQCNPTPTPSGIRRIYPLKIVSTPLRSNYLDNKLRILKLYSALRLAASKVDESSVVNVDYTQMKNYHRLRPLIKFIRAHSEGICHESAELSESSTKQWMKEIIHGLVYPEGTQESHTDRVEAFDLISLEKMLASPVVIDPSEEDSRAEYDLLHRNEISHQVVTETTIALISYKEKFTDKTNENVMNPTEAEKSQINPEKSFEPISVEEDLKKYAKTNTKQEEDFDSISIERNLTSREGGGLDDTQLTNCEMLKPLLEFIRAHPEGISHAEVSELTELSISDQEMTIDTIVESIINPTETEKYENHTNATYNSISLEEILSSPVDERSLQDDLQL